MNTSLPTATAASSGYLRIGRAITLGEARRVAEAAEACAQARGWPMVIAIVDPSGTPVLLQRLDHAQHGSVRIAVAKAETAARFKRPTKVFEDAVAAGGLGLRILATPGLCPLDGGLPLVADGELVGAIGVSGMQSTQDAEVAEAGAGTPWAAGTA